MGVKETVGGQNHQAQQLRPLCPLQYCVSMLSDATQPGWVLESELTAAIGFMARKYQLPASPPMSFAVILAKPGFTLRTVLPC